MKSTRHIKRFAVVMAFALVAIGALAAVAMADDATADLVLGGQTDVTMDSVTIGDFSATTLLPSGVATTQATASSFSVTDARGTGAGWKVSMSASQFTGPTVAEQTVHKLTAGIMYLQPISPDAVSVDFGSATKPSITNTDPIAVDNGSVSIASASQSDDVMDGQGMGKYTFPAASFHVAVPAGAYATTYTSTLTVTLAQTP
jgi:hypothetical protein